MEADFTSAEIEQIEEGIRNKYAKVSISPEGLFAYPTGRSGLAALRYDREIVRTLPAGAVDSYCGVGNPFSLGPVHEGDAILDIGCGGGVDTLIAATMVGPTGEVVGIDVSPEMIDRAKRNLSETNLENVTFQVAGAEDLPFPERSFDVVISNGAFNLVPNKSKALAEAFRVLKPGGRLMIADQFLVDGLVKDPQTKIGKWAN